jgi:hypothetical protein
LVLTDEVRSSDDSALLRRITPHLRWRVVFIDFATLSDTQLDDHLRALRAEVTT